MNPRLGHLLIVSHVLVRRHGGELYLQGGFGRHLDVFADRAERVTILTCAKDVDEAPDEYRLRARNVTIVALPPFQGGSRLKRYWSMCRAALAAAARLPELMKTADVLHPRLPSTVGMVGAVFSRFYSGPVVYYLAGDWVTALRAKKSMVARGAAAVLAPVLRWMVKNGHCFTAGEAVARSLEGDDERVTVVMTTALDSSHVLDRDDAVGRVVRPPRVMLFVGAVWKMKGAHHFVDAVPELRLRHPELRARLIGQIVGDDWLSPKLLSLGLTDVVEHHPHMAWDRLMETYDEADVFVMPSVEGRGEGVPKVALEAMARGVPVVASDVGGIRALIRDGVNGLLVESGSVDALVEAVSRIWEDQELRASLSEAGVGTAAGYGLDALIDQMVDRMVPGSSEAPVLPNTRPQGPAVRESAGT
ncbi:MAG: glycosyltransferase [Longimicrobiales bacterium]